MEINKPISIAIHDAKEDIVKTINKHNLPASVLLLLMKDIMTEVTILDSKVYNQDLQNYQNQLLSSQNEIENIDNNNNNKEEEEDIEVVPDDNVIIEE